MRVINENISGVINENMNEITDEKIKINIIVSSIK